MYFDSSEDIFKFKSVVSSGLIPEIGNGVKVLYVVRGKDILVYRR